MADTADKVVIEITLDDGSVKQVFGRIKKDAQDLGKDGDKALSKTTSGLVSNLGDAKEELIAIGSRFAIIGGSVAAVGLTIKKALDFSIAGEQLLAAEKTFDRFAANAGLANLRDSLEAASQGLVDVSDILPRATTALLNFESGAERIPELLNLAVDSARQFGGTAEDRFEALIAAVESGNTKILRNQGIVLDANKVFNEYANSVGLTASELTLANRQQALLNAVLAEGARRASDQVESITPLADEFKRVQVAANDFIENLQKATASAVGPFFASILKGISDSITAFNGLDGSGAKAAKAIATALGTTFLGPIFGSSVSAVNGISEAFDETTAKAEKNLQNTRAEIAKLENQLASLAKPSLADWSSALQAKQLKTRISELKQDIPGLVKQLEDLRAKAGQNVSNQVSETPLGPTAGPKTKSGFEFTPEQRAAVEARNAEIQALNVAAFQAEISLGEQRLARITDEETRKQAITDLFDQQSTLLLGQREAEKEAIRKKFAGSGAIFTEQREAALAAIDEKYKNLSLQREEEYFGKLNDKARKAAEEYNKSIKDGIVRATVAGAESIGRSLQKGAMNWQDFGTSIAVVLGDLAIQIGTAIIAQSSALLAFTLALQSLGPAAAAAGIAAGIGLVIFGSALKASVGAGGGGGEISTPGGGSVGSITSPTETAPISDTIEQQQPNTEVVVNINGSVYDSDETGMRIVDLINSAFDKQGIVIKRGVVA